MLRVSSNIVFFLHIFPANSNLVSMDLNGVQNQSDVNVFSLKIKLWEV